MGHVYVFGKVRLFELGFAEFTVDGFVGTCIFM
jgi:hypothetical protein